MTILATILLLAAAASVYAWTSLRGPSRVAFWYCAAESLASTIGAISYIIGGRAQSGVVPTAFAGLFAWLAWLNRGRPDRRLSKAFGRVRDLGHRLTVEAVRP
jgi:hypothetical protein